MATLTLKNYPDLKKRVSKQTNHKPVIESKQLVNQLTTDTGTLSPKAKRRLKWRENWVDKPIVDIPGNITFEKYLFDAGLYPARKIAMKTGPSLAKEGRSVKISMGTCKIGRYVANTYPIGFLQSYAERNRQEIDAIINELKQRTYERKRFHK